MRRQVLSREIGEKCCADPIYKNPNFLTDQGVESYQELKWLEGSGKKLLRSYREVSTAK